MDPADFASLLEREPSDAGDSIEDWMWKCEDAARRNLTLRATIDSQASRIKSLEDVLVAIRAKAQASRAIGATGKDMSDALASIRDLISETLDPCKPWCVQEPGHPGSCAAVDDDDLEE